MQPANIRCSQSAEGVDLAILGEITPYTAEEIIRALAYFKDQPVTITMMSPGGDAFASLGLYDYMKGKDVTVRIYGIAASGASIISAAAKRVEMAAGSYMMIHNAYSLGGGPEHVTDSINDRQVEVFASRSGKTRDKVRKMLAAETFMDAPTAKAEGFADAVFDPMKVAASLNNMKPMSEVVTPVAEVTEEATPQATPQVVAVDPGDEQPEKVEEPAAVEASEEIEVEIPVTPLEAVQAGFRGTFKAKVKVDGQAGEMLAALIAENKTLRASLDEANAAVEKLAPEAEAAKAAAVAAEEATAKVAEVAAEVEKLKAEPLAPPVVSDAAPAVVVPGNAQAAQPKRTAIEEHLQKTADAIDAAIKRRGIK